MTSPWYTAYQAPDGKYVITTTDAQLNAVLHQALARFLAKAEVNLIDLDDDEISPPASTQPCSSASKGSFDSQPPSLTTSSTTSSSDLARSSPTIFSAPPKPVFRHLFADEEKVSVGTDELSPTAVTPPCISVAEQDQSQGTSLGQDGSPKRNGSASRSKTTEKTNEQSQTQAPHSPQPTPIQVIQASPPAALINCLPSHDGLTRAQAENIWGCDFKNSGTNLVIHNAMRPGIKASLMCTMLRDLLPAPSATGPPCVWIILNDFLARDMYIGLPHFGHKMFGNAALKSRLALVTTTMEPKEIQAVINQRPSILVVEGSKLTGLQRANIVDLSASKTLIFDSLSMMVSWAEGVHIPLALRALQRHHNIINLVSTLSPNIVRDWKVETSGCHSRIDRTPQLVDDVGARLNFISQFIDFIPVKGYAGDRLQHVVMEHLAAGKRTAKYGDRRILAVCKPTVLERYTDRRSSASKETFIMGQSIPVARSGLPASLNQTSLAKFHRGTADTLITTSHYVYGAVWEFVPVLIFAHIPKLFDELHEMLNFYLMLCSRQRLTPPHTIPPHGIAPRIQIFYGKEDVQTLSFFHGKFLEHGVGFELPHHKPGFKWERN